MPIDIETAFNSAESKRFAFPGKIVWGRRARDGSLDLVAGHRSVDVICDEYFADHPFYTELIDGLGDRLRIRHTLAGAPGPQAIRRLTDAFPTPADGLVALGGGGTLDFAKGMLAQWLYGDLEGVGMGARRGEPPRSDVRRPLFVALPTTAGSGAEASRYYVTYDETTRAKVHGKSWRLVADWILLDPIFLASAPPRLVLHGAFDAFVHYLESMVCRGERSWFGEMLSISGMTRIVSALGRLERMPETADRDDGRLELLYAASLGGMAISNIRTGHIHEAGGALLEHTSLTHAETLFVFLHAACEDYATTLDPQLAPLWKAFAALPDPPPIFGLRDVANWWSERFVHIDAVAPIAAEVARVSGHSKIREAIFDRIWADRVWVEKESPVPLSAESVVSFVDRSLSRFTDSRAIAL